MTARNIFALAKPATKVKVLIYGPSESGKTLAGLSFPRAAVIDSENGTGLHVSSVDPFHVYNTKSLDDIDDALTMIREDRGQNFDTLVIDSVSVFYDMLLAGAGRTISYRERAAINMQMTNFYNKLSSLSVHLVLIAREAPVYEGSGSSLKVIGLKPDTDPGIDYLPDFIVRMQSDYSGIVEKSRGYKLPDVLPRVDWSTFEPAINPAVICAKEYVAATTKRTGLKAAEIREILGITSMREFGDWCDPATAERADAMIAAALETAKGGTQ